MSTRRYGLYTLILLTLVNVINHGNRNVLFPMYEDLRATFGLTNSELGLLGSAYMFMLAAAALFFGWAGDRFDKRKVLALGLSLWSVSAVGSAAASSFGQLLLCRALVGMGTASCVPICISILCQVYPADTKARTVAIFNLGIFLGGAFGFLAGTYMGYPGGILALAVPGLVLAVLTLTIGLPGTDRAPQSQGDRGVFLRQAVELLTIPTMRWVLGGAVLISFAAGGYASWFFEFISVTKGLGPDNALVLFGVALVGGLLGVISGGFVGDYLQRRFAYGRLAAISIGIGGSIPFTVIFLFADVGILFYIAACLAMFFMTWYHGPLAAVVDDLAAADRSSTAQALVLCTIHLLGTAPSSWVIGELADEVGLRDAMFVPTAALLVAMFVFMGGWRGIERDLLRASPDRS